MALPQKVIEQLEREPPKTPGWSGQLLMFSSTIFSIALFIYLGLLYGYKPYLESEVQKLQDQIQTFSQQIPAEDQEKMINFYSQLINLRTILADHVISSEVFEWLERNAQVNIQYDNMHFNFVNNSMTFDGLGRTMDDVTQQFAIFSSRPEILRLVIGAINFTDKGWSFSATLFFDKNYFRVNSQ